jgi:predicted secreted protein
MAYSRSQAFAGRSTVLNYSTNPPSVAYVAMAEIKTVAFSGMKYDLSDVTNMQSSNFKEWLPTLADSGDLTITGNMIPNDVTEEAVLGFFNSATLVTWQVVLPPGGNGTHQFSTSEGTFTFTAYVSSIDYSIPVEKEASITVKLKITGEITFTGGE